MNEVFKTMTHYRQFLRDTTPEHGVTTYQATCMEACRVAAVATGPIGPETTGIVFYTRLGEHFPETWKQMDDLGQRLRPRQFGQAVLNSAPGYATIELGLCGPQVTVVDGDAEEVARLLLEGGIAPFMVVCEDRGDFMEGWLVVR